MATPQPSQGSKPQASPIWVIMPVLAHPEYTRAAIADVLAQTVPIRLLIVNQGVEAAFRDELERIAEAHPDCVLVWHHQPPLPSLAATWNRALRLVWEAGGEEALVVNNDVRLHRETIRTLRRVLTVTGALFVSCVGRHPEDWFPDVNDQLVEHWWAEPLDPAAIGHGGPDFSCFLIDRACHDRFQFDEAFVPAFCEDLDYHRRLLLAGEGQRIFSVNLPYLHYGSATLKTMDPAKRQAVEAQISAGSRAYYARKWGGPVNQERFVLPFHQTEDRDVSTPALQRMVQEDRAHELPSVDWEYLGGQGNWHPSQGHVSAWEDYDRAERD